MADELEQVKASVTDGQDDTDRPQPVAEAQDERARTGDEDN